MAVRADRRILLATDGSPSADAAVDLLCTLRLRPQDRVDVVSVASVPVLALTSGFAEFSLAEGAATEHAADAAARLARCGVVAGTHVADGLVPDAIIRTAAAVGADIIVVGSRGRGWLVGTLLGSVARALAHTSPIPVLVVRDRREAPRRIVVGVDGSPDSRAAIDALTALPLAPDTEIVLVHVVPDRREDTSHATELLRLVACRMPASAATRVEVEHGQVAEAILSRAAALGSDLVVLGSRSSRGLLPGSTADRVLSGAHCAVLVARAAERVRSEAPVRVAAAAG